MKLRTKMLVTGIMMAILPAILIVIAFITIGFYLMRSDQQAYGIHTVDYAMMSGTVQEINERTDKVYKEVLAQVKEDASLLENRTYLEELNQCVEGESSYVLVRKGEGVYYTGNDVGTQTLLPKLPKYGFENPSDDNNYYINDMRKMIKQIDFEFGDGSKGSFFLVTKIGSVIARPLLVDMVVAIFCILIFNSLMLTRWIQNQVIDPVTELDIAMQKIAEGNLQYRLPEHYKGEIGQLFRNYEDMRLRLKETADEKMESEKQNRELISNISHDLKTPITAVKGYVEGIMDGVADTPEKMDKYIRTIYNKANDMDRLINELTIYSKIDSNRILYNFHRLNVAEYFGDCVEEVGVELESRNIKLDYSNLVSPDTKVIADPEQLKRVINNIISNSVKYMDKEKGQIDIRILDEVDSIRVEIEDNGRGIAAKDLGNIFERFFRTDSSRNSSKGGSGIGLSIVKKIVEDHGGYIWATGKEGEGTCIHFVIRKYRETGKE